MEPEEVNEKIIPRKLFIFIFIGLVLLVSILLLGIYFVFIYPSNQVSQLGITNVTEKVNLINQIRTTSISFIATLAQIFGGVAVAIGIYFAWGNLKVALETLESNQTKAKDELKLAQEGQITERFTRAIDQLGAIDKDGNPAIEIRLGGIYALERIANESESDYWPIMEILTAYVRKNSPNIGIKNKDIYGVFKQDKISLDIEAILTVIRRRKYSFNDGESNSLDLSSSYLGWADLRDVNLEGANLQWANLYGSGLQGANFEKAILEEVIFEDANLKGTNFQGAKLGLADFKKASLIGAVFKEAKLYGADLQEADLQGTNFEKTILSGAYLKGAKNLTVDQLLEVKSLYNAKLDEKLLTSLKNDHPKEYQNLTQKLDE